MKIAIDVIFVLFLALMFYFGYKGGFLKKAWWLIDVALIVLLGFFLSPTIKQAFVDHTGVYTSLESAFRSLIGDGTFINLDAAETASLVLNIIIWIALGIIIIILMAILKHLLKKLRKYPCFGVIDGVLGGIYGVVITFAIFMLIGVIVGTFTVFAPISKAYEFCGDTYIFKYVFGGNPLQTFVNNHVPLGTWIKNLLN